MTIKEEIQQLKVARNALILAHNYQPGEIQDVADIVGDSLELAVKAKEAEEPVLVVCGVRFMAETAKLLSPEKTVLLPVPDAGCPLSDFLTPEMIHEAREKYPGAAVVVYVNSSAEVKAAADITCTSANAADVVKSLDADMILFGPDANLASFVQGQVQEKRIIPLPAEGHCYVHTAFTEDQIREAKAKGWRVVCHPECPPGIQSDSDLIASTGGMVQHACDCDEWFICTERDMGYRLRKLHPNRHFHVDPNAICKDMKKTTIEDLLRTLRDGVYEVVIPDEIAVPARKAVEAMIGIRR
ncbi:quinolinate synthase NadA [Methanocalculus taiwanensis]|uniref:Quinolinate synthase n=1 Tax=Methanocalculus taiwanensis TaxID=106207 RepID=A0ABD4TFQ3_9EURY|nr:quinolinate synthase NadA [Methanocalculus taiwanensis]MCQ1537546.1 quinolinate synthase NadA [Methanocalculus taiwanensis]